MCSSCCTDFAAMLFNFFFERRSREINGGEANDNAAANDETAGGASSSRTSTEGQGMATSSGYDYEVFLSFNGSDTRAGFTDFLYTSLNDAGIRTFKDDKELGIGEEFAPELLQAINQSKISIPIFSKGYASSVWCLKELVQMVECQKTGRQKIIPIFYDVAPSEVRHQTESYAKAFLAHENKKRHDEKTIKGWKDALSAVGAINGWDLHSKKENRREGEFAKELTHKVFSELKKGYLVVSDYLVCVDNHVDAIMEKIGAGTSETRIIGIHGMGGIGKTTIAKMIYNKLLHDFENCCSLRDIREVSERNGIHCLQNQLISGILKMKGMDIKDIDEGTQTIKERLSNKRVLLLLDDVHEKNHADALVGERDWFGKGSKLIITTRNKEVLDVLKVDDRYELMGMDRDQSLQLFSKHAFRRDSPLIEYINQSKRAIGIARGLPLALEVIGSLLSRTEKKRWDDILEKLEKVPHVDVQSKLKISFDALEVRQQHIFLDIACFFIGYDKDIMVHFWEKSKFFPKEAMEVLQNMSLIKIGKSNKVSMHDQLRDLGREIVRQESKMKIEKQSRVWDPKEALDLLRRHEGKTKVEALHLRFDHERRHYFTCKDFKRISNLRFLQVNGSEEYFRAEERLLWHESPSNVLPTNVFLENLDLLPHLQWLSWHGIPPTFKIANFSMENVVILDLSQSKITHDWQGWSHMKETKNLKILNLTGCNCLERIPIFSAEVNLERLILQRCKSLTEIDRSICHLKSLVSLDVSYCEKLRRLPEEMGRDLVSLEYLSLKFCKSLERLPNTIGNLKSLIKLDIFETGIKELPDSIGNLESLIELNTNYTGIKELPDSVGKLKILKLVKMNWFEMSKIPDALWTIEKLEEIDAQFGDLNVEVEIGNCIYRNHSLRILRLSNVRINVVPRLPESLIILGLCTLHMDTFPNLSNLTNLEELILTFGPCDDAGESNGPVEEYLMPRWIGNLSKLETLFLDSYHVTHLPMDISSLLPRLQRLSLICPNLRCVPSLPSSLSSLDLESEHVTALPADISSLLPRLQRLELLCPNLRCLPCLPSSLSFLLLQGCMSFGSLGDLSNLKNLSDLTIIDSVIPEIRGVDGSENLDLQLSELQRVGILPDLSNNNQLACLHVFECSNLVEIQGELPQCLESLRICGCGSLQKLPDLSSLKGLKIVEIRRCGKLNVEAISLLCSEKAVIFEGD
ncbi:disease resistance protein RUN1-like [Syzygium oleosum]|uniref:disease resistance protein RUN1-like n=1 Tax=Syzygium oleosum TaxID=219896 RepID=UPI0024B9BA0D|nr:disease resistance protein RUN1-like [Syzygium oleosum]XP_056164734.1 disease resistance protein RUN1-like [Syzygium oleosum]XP_056164769.1 disease resistance protein RUN1-like [Syzygium oleosum]XP_056164798.1 disease resistance protein RUN1-like [Syzygium oleosum]XP_056164826.1 disease resistance protein RUN1-like [Syzygium oleosum]XP_056164852.1 disease resistance protein RUN1-like [Syzygium oleosum]XP_056164873.1 disease resistance protein RUN1-like [Syzygium oleosum]XP_056164907.1 dis